MLKHDMTAYPPNHPQVGACYRHTDGGYYQVLMMGRYVVDGAPMIAYQHLWPFDDEVWFRSLLEWYERFTRVEELEVETARAANRSEVQRRIIAAKAARRAKLCP